MQDRMKELVRILNEAGRAYYGESREIMTNYEYDALYAELERLEAESGIVLSDSPTQHVGYEVQTSLPKETHAEPMLSLDKTKDVDVLASFVGSRTALLSWKMDGLTVVLTYRDGSLAKAVTRGNGIVGEVVTPNARTFKNVPLKIPFRGELVLRGEAVIHYSDFERINREIPEADGKYKNPRNLCSGSVRQLNPAVTAERCVYFYAFTLVSARGADGAGPDFGNSHAAEFEFLKKQGFTVVPYRKVTGDSVPAAVREFEAAIAENDFPSDGLVALYDEIAYGESLGRTAKFPRNAFAFKWQDEVRETTLLAVEWSPSRTGLINPVAVFEPVELEGTTVKRASVHNLSVVRTLKLGIGDRITVYKANMIIPQIAENLTGSGNLPVPERCPVCGGETRIETEEGSGVQTLHCTNPDCQAKKVRSYALFASRDALNIEGLSEATLEKMIGKGLIHEEADLFRLPEHRSEIVEMEGFGELSFRNLADSLARAKKTTLSRVLYGLGISNIGVAGAKLLSRAFGGDLGKLRSATEEELASIDSIGPVTAASIAAFFRDPDRMRRLDDLLGMIELQTESASEGIFSGKTFVITGSLAHFENRRAMTARIEELGGKVASSVSAKTDYLINNDSASASAKNRAAKALGVPILTEEEFLEMTEHADQAAK